MAKLDDLLNGPYSSSAMKAEYERRMMEQEIRMREQAIRDRMRELEQRWASIASPYQNSPGIGQNTLAQAMKPLTKSKIGSFGKGVNKLMDPLEDELQQKKGSIQVQDLDIAEAHEVIDKVLKTNIVPFLWGPPGIGKSSLVRDICKNHAWKLVDLRLSLLNPVDLLGLPSLDKQGKKVDWYPPAFLPKYDEKETGILFLDEINLAPLSVQAAAYQLILDKKVGEYRFPPHWRIVAAGNRETDRANVYKLSAPLANRFVHFNITANMKTWRKWATDGNIRPEIVDYLVLQPSLLMQMPKDQEKAFPTPRSWAFTSELLDAFDFDSDQGVDQHLQHIILGTIGEGVGKEFIAFLQDYKLKGVSKMVDEFVKTGKYTMPRASSTRYAFIMAIFDAYISEKIPEHLYKQFLSGLSGEEQKTVELFEQKHGGAMRAKKKLAGGRQPNMNMPMSALTMGATIGSHDLMVNDPSIFQRRFEALIFDNQGHIEEISWMMNDGDVLVGVTRGKNGTIARNWDAGDFIQPL